MFEIEVENFLLYIDVILVELIDLAEIPTLSPSLYSFEFKIGVFKRFLR